jgi:hypothetical protein
MFHGTFHDLRLPVFTSLRRHLGHLPDVVLLRLSESEHKRISKDGNRHNRQKRSGWDVRTPRLSVPGCISRRERKKCQLRALLGPSSRRKHLRGRKGSRTRWCTKYTFILDSVTQAEAPPWFKHEGPPEPLRLPNEGGKGGHRTLEVQLESPPAHLAAVNSYPSVGLGDNRDHLCSLGCCPASAGTAHIPDSPQRNLAGAVERQRRQPVCSACPTSGRAAGKYSNPNNRVQPGAAA